MTNKTTLAPREIKPLSVSKNQVQEFCAGYAGLRDYGIDIRDVDLQKMAQYGQDANLVAPLTSPSVTNPVQLLQNWLPGFTRVITAPRKIDEFAGITTSGEFADEEIIQPVYELTGNAQPYGDYTNIPASSWNLNFERRTVARFEEGMRVGQLEEERAARVRANAADFKREAAAEALEIIRNQVGFFGYNEGQGRTYGFLNDPDLPAYTDVPPNASGVTEWSQKTYIEIVSDLLTAFAQLRNQSQDRIDPKTEKITIAISTNSIDFLSRTTDFGVSVHTWLRENYPNTRVISAPELNEANGGDNVFYLYAETVGDSGSDDSRTFLQVVPTKFRTNGVEQKAKSYVESYANATAGIMVKRPYAVTRFSGI